jgi:hypothetical protein
MQARRLTIWRNLAVCVVAWGVVAFAGVPALADCGESGTCTQQCNAAKEASAYQCGTSCSSIIPGWPNDECEAACQDYCGAAYHYKGNPNYNCESNSVSCEDEGCCGAHMRFWCGCKTNDDDR